NIPPDRLLAALRRGDIFTHLYHGSSASPFIGEKKTPSPELLAARERGVIFDVGHGAGAFWWEVAEAAARENGFWPDTISTDIHSYNLHGPVFDMPTTMSKLLYLGMPLEQ